VLPAERAAGDGAEAAQSLEGHAGDELANRRRRRTSA
jgi:hypothetical protein